MEPVETLSVRHLDHVRWVGGGSGAGKTTVSRMLAERFECRLYSSDATIRVHSATLDSAEAPLLDAFRCSDMDERWVQRDPATMARTFPWFQGEGFDLIVEDLRRLPNDRVVLAEGFRLLPRLVQPHLSDVRHAVWLIPTTQFRREAFLRRRGADAFWSATSNPTWALANLLERDRIFTDAVAVEAARAHSGSCASTGLGGLKTWRPTWQRNWDCAASRTSAGTPTHSASRSSSGRFRAKLGGTRTNPVRGGR